MNPVNDELVKLMGDLYGETKEERRRLHLGRIVREVFEPNIDQFNQQSQAQIREWRERYCK